MPLLAEHYKYLWMITARIGGSHPHQQNVTFVVGLFAKL